MPQPRVPTAAAALGSAGLLPFLAGALGPWLLDEPRRGASLHLLAGYAAVILSFLGAVHWGLAMRGDGGAPGRAMAASVVPALIAWFALALPAPGALVVLAAGFVLVQLMDARAVARGVAPAWYSRLRVPLTCVVLASLTAALAGVL